MDFHAFCTKYGVENIQNEELRDFYGHNFRGSCTKRARMRRFLERFTFDRYFSIVDQILTKFHNFHERSPKAPYLRPISARDTGDMPTKFAQATYGNLNTPNMEWNFRWRAKNMDGWILGGMSKIHHVCRSSNFWTPPAPFIHFCGSTTKQKARWGRWNRSLRQRSRAIRQQRPPPNATSSQLAS